VWKRLQGNHRAFNATHETFCFDYENGNAPDGIAKITDRIVLSKDGESLSGRQHVDAYDTEGHLVFVADGTMTGTRMHAEAPPAP
jgi:hypothetical protein